MKKELLEWVVLNYEPVITGRQVMWNLDGAEALYTTDEVIEDFFERRDEEFAPLEKCLECGGPLERKNLKGGVCCKCQPWDD